MDWEETEALGKERDRIVGLAQGIMELFKPSDITYIRLENCGWTPETLDTLGINEHVAEKNTTRIKSVVVRNCGMNDVEDIIDCLSQILYLKECARCEGPMQDYEKFCEGCGAENPDFDETQFLIVRCGTIEEFCAEQCKDGEPHEWGPDEDRKHCHACGRELLPVDEEDSG